MEWLQQGLADGSLPYNEAGASVHFVDQGMALVSPRMFRDFAATAHEDPNAVQQEVIGAGWHVKAPGNSNILHFAVVKRDGARPGGLAAAGGRGEAQGPRAAVANNIHTLSIRERRQNAIVYSQAVEF